MGLKTTADDAFDQIFSALSDYVRKADFVSRENKTEASYDPTVVLTEDSTRDLTDIDVVVVGFSHKDIDGVKIMERDMKCFVKRADITAIIPIKRIDAVFLKALPDFTGDQKFEIVAWNPIPTTGNPSGYQLQLRGVE